MTARMTEVDRSLIERVRKLLDKAEATDNAHEAEAFASKAADLIAQHRIDPAQLAEREDGSELALGELNVGRGAYVRGRIALLANVGDAHDVRMVFQSTPTGSVVFMAGRQVDLDLVGVLYASLHSQAAAQMQLIKRSTGAATQRERRAFLFGFADRIGQLMAESKESARAKSEQAADGGAATALAVRERRERVDQFAAERWGKVRSASRPAGVAPGGYLAGASAAERADVGRSRLRGRPEIGRGGDRG
ncbi:MAG: DUF2786 domain-containing protein [Ilumatobacter sp.]